MNKLKRMEVVKFVEGSFRLEAHFGGVGFGMNFSSQPKWETVVICLRSLATLIEEHFEDQEEIIDVPHS